MIDREKDLFEQAMETSGIQVTNILKPLQEVRVGKNGKNLMFSIVSPNFEYGKVYDFRLQIDRRHAERVSYVEDGEVEFAIFGHYKNTTRKIIEGRLVYRLTREVLTAIVRFPMGERFIDDEFLKKARMEIIFKGFEVGEQVSFLGTSVRPIEEIMGNK